MAADKQKKEKGAMALIIVVLLLTLVGAGTGLAVGSLLQSGSVTESVGSPGEKPPEPTPSDTADKATDHGGEHKSSADHASADGADTASEEEEAEAEAEAEPDPGTMKVVPFPPVLTTLAEPKGKWIRVEGSILISTESHDPPELLAERSGEQILSYLRTLRLDQIEGPSGILGLRDDLNEMIKVLSNGEAKGVLIHGLIVE